MNYRYIDGVAIADVAFEAWGPDIESLFAAAADATMNVMVEDLDSIHQAVDIACSIENPQQDLLLFSFLNEFLYYKDAQQLLLRTRDLSILQSEDGFVLKGVLSGEALDRSRHRLLVDVKAVTLHRFSLEQVPDGWKAFVILDI